jgi:hypothetical protein
VLLVIVPGTRSSPVDKSNDQPQEER